MHKKETLILPKERIDKNKQTFKIFFQKKSILCTFLSRCLGCRCRLTKHFILEINVRFSKFFFHRDQKKIQWSNFYIYERS